MVVGCRCAGGMPMKAQPLEKNINIVKADAAREVEARVA
jgi:hypothetical protein